MQPFWAGTKVTWEGGMSNSRTRIGNTVLEVGPAWAWAVGCSRTRATRSSRSRSSATTASRARCCGVGWWLERGTDDGCRPLAAHRENEQAALSAARTSWSYVVRVTHILRRRGLSPGNSCPYRVPPVLVPVCVCVRARPALKLEQLECMVTACTSTRAGERKLKKVQD